MFADVKGHVARAMTIAGSDSGGGAGIQADLKTMHQFGVYGASVVTALTAQNTTGVQGVLEVSADFVRMQMDSVLGDIGADAIKTGMLANADIIRAVSDGLRDLPMPLVVDPVMIAKGGESLLRDSSVKALRNLLIPRADIVTPNIPEASVLCERTIDTWEDCHDAARRLAAMGARTVIVKGGHMDAGHVRDCEWRNCVPDASAIDIVLSQDVYTYFVTPRVASNKTHGTGCTFSSAVAAMLARGSGALSAVATAKRYIFEAVRSAADWDVGHGHGPTDHSVVVATCAIDAGGVYVLDADGWIRVR